MTVGTTPRRFVHDESGRLIGKYGATVATINAEHVWLMPEVGEGGYESLALVGPTTTSWLHGDHLGTPVMITSSAGVRVNDMQATPFGNRYRTAANSPKTALAFPGQIIDIAGRHYNMHRDYDSTLGRYLQADPIGLDGGDNVYAYVGANPITRSDPNGLRPVPLPSPISMPMAPSDPIVPWDFDASFMSDSEIAAVAWAICQALPGACLAAVWINDPEAVATHKEYIDRYMEPAPPFKDECEELNWQLTREQNLLLARNAWDAKFLPGRHSGMNGEIQSLNRIRNLKKNLEKLGCECP